MLPSTFADVRSIDELRHPIFQAETCGGRGRRENGRERRNFEISRAPLVSPKKKQCG